MILTGILPLSFLSLASLAAANHHTGKHSHREAVKKQLVDSTPDTAVLTADTAVDTDEVTLVNPETAQDCTAAMLNETMSGFATNNIQNTNPIYNQTIAYFYVRCAGEGLQGEFPLDWFTNCTDAGLQSLEQGLVIGNHSSDWLYESAVEFYGEQCPSASDITEVSD